MRSSVALTTLLPLAMVVTARSVPLTPCEDSVDGDGQREATRTPPSGQRA